MVKEEGDLGIGKNVADSAKIDGLGTLGLLVYDRIQGFAVEEVAERDEVRRAGWVCGGEAGDGAFGKDSVDFGCEGQGGFRAD